MILKSPISNPLEMGFTCNSLDFWLTSLRKKLRQAITEIRAAVVVTELPVTNNEFREKYCEAIKNFSYIAQNFKPAPLQDLQMVSKPKMKFIYYRKKTTHHYSKTFHVSDIKGIQELQRGLAGARDVKIDVFFATSVVKRAVKSLFFDNMMLSTGFSSSEIIQ